MKKHTIRWTLIGLIVLVTTTFVNSTPLTTPKVKKRAPQIVFLDETNVEGNRPAPMSTFSADHLSKTIRPYSVNKNVRPLLQHYEGRSNLHHQAELFYDSRSKTKSW